jgi:hypothetical protein
LLGDKKMKNNTSDMAPNLEDFVKNTKKDLEKKIKEMILDKKIASKKKRPMQLPVPLRARTSTPDSSAKT